MRYLLYTLALFFVPYLLYYGIRTIVVYFCSKQLFEDAIEYGIYDSVWASRKKYKVRKGTYDEYILTSLEDNEEHVVSKEHLWQCLRKRKGIPSWPIAYPNSKQSEIETNKDNI